MYRHSKSVYLQKACTQGSPSLAVEHYQQCLHVEGPSGGGYCLATKGWAWRDFGHSGVSATHPAPSLPGKGGGGQQLSKCAS